MVDYLIVGQGLAGSLLARELLRLDRTVCVVDPGDPASSSRIAAGILNPVTGKRFALSWNVERLLPSAIATYRDLEAELGATLCHAVPVIRLFRGPEEAAHCRERLSLPEYRPFVRSVVEAGALDASIHCEHGGVRIEGGGWVDTANLLRLLRARFDDAGILVGDSVRRDDVHVVASGVQWRSIRAGRVVWCEGAHACVNPWLSRVPMQPSKGEVLTVQIPGMQLPGILLRGVHVVPIRDEIFRVGATYDREDRTATPTAERREQLARSLREVIKTDFEIIDHMAALRPGTRRRTPVVGSLPDMPAMAIFNGLGSKGGLVAPYYARQLAEHLVLGHPLDPAVDIARNQT